MNDVISADDQAAEARRFLGLLFSADDWIELRLLPSKQSRRFRLGDECEAHDALTWAVELSGRRDKPQHAFVAVNPVHERNAAPVPPLQTLAVEFHDVPPMAALAGIDAGCLPEPTVVTAAGAGSQVFWRLAVPVADAAVCRAAIREIVEVSGGDGKPCLYAWLPGSATEHPGRPLCRVVWRSAERHDIEEFVPDEAGVIDVPTTPGDRIRGVADRIEAAAAELLPKIAPPSTGDADGTPATLPFNSKRSCG